MAIPNQYIFVYQTICETNGKSYVGIHHTNNLNDGYIGCGIFNSSDARKQNLLFHRAVKKHGYASFRKYILSFFDTYNEALEEEKFIVNKNWVSSNDNYNTAIGGKGNTIGWMNDDTKQKWKESIKDGVNKWLSNGGLELLIERSKTAKRTRMFGNKNPMYGKESLDNQRSINQYNTDNILIQSFKTITEASIKLNIQLSSISFCCVGRYLTAGGYIFRYQNYSEKEKKILQSNLKRLSKEEKDKKSATAFKLSISKKGKKNSIKVINILTGEKLVLLSQLQKIYPEYNYHHISYRIKKYNKFKDWATYK